MVVHAQRTFLSIGIALCLPIWLTACQMTEFFHGATHSDAHSQLAASKAQAPSFETVSKEPIDTQTIQELLQQDALQQAVATARIQEDLWERIRLQLSLYSELHEQVEQQKQWYASHPRYIERISQQAEPFLYYIVQEIERRELPLELALVPIVESAFDIYAYSHGQASGIWQFIPSTAKHYGIQINWWYDGRRDIVAATQTALDYFTLLSRTFDGDWLLALAAYNGGQGRVANAIKKNKAQGLPTDFWSLSLPKETKNYVPKVLALSAVLAERPENQLAWKFIPNQQHFEVIELEHQIDLVLAAELAELSLKELHLYNSGYNRWATTPEGPQRLVLPVASAIQFRHAIAQTTPDTWLNWQRHHIQSGESLEKIAKRYQTTVQALQHVNQLTSGLIRAGDYLLIPISNNPASIDMNAIEARLAVSPESAPTRQKYSHIVRSGDTLWDLARSYKVSISQLQAWNQLTSQTLRIGQELVIWTERKTAAAPSGLSDITRTIQYAVRQGDSLERIAHRFHVTVTDIERWNQIQRSHYLQPGQKLKLHVPITQGG